MNNSYRLLITIILLIYTTNLFGIDPNFENDSIRSTNLYNEAVNLNQNGLYPESLDTFLLALQIREELFGEDSYRLAPILNAIGTVYKNLGLYDLAIQYTQRAEEAYIQGYGENSERISRVYLNLGNIYRSKLNYNEALNYFNKAVNVRLMQEDINYSSVADANYSVAEIYFQLFEYEKAINIILENIKNAYEDTKIRYYELLGGIYQELEKNTKAEESYLNAINTAINFFDKKNINVGLQYLNIAFFYISTENFEKASFNLDKAREIIMLTEKEKGEYLARLYKIIGAYFEKKPIQSTDFYSFKENKHSNFIEAINYYTKALSALDFPEEVSDETDVDTIYCLSLFRCIDLLKVKADAYMQVAALFEGQNNITFNNALGDAISNYKITGELIQRAKKEITDEESKLQLADIERSTFIKSIQASYKSYMNGGKIADMNIAFQNAELLKAGSLFEKLSNDEAMKNSFIPDSLVQLEQRINSNITTYTEIRYNETVATDPNKEAISKTDSILFDLKRRRTELNNFLEQNYTQYYNLKYSNSALSISDIQAKLKGNEILIEYVLNDNDSIPELYSFVISKDNARFYQQNTGNQFNKNIEDMFHFMSNPRYMFTTNEDSKAFCSSSYQLYEKLISPFQNDISDKKIIIIPDGMLSYVSFDALLQELPDTTNTIYFNKLNYLLKKNCINYSYSANLLFGLEHKRKNIQKRILAFAPEYFTDTIRIGGEEYPLQPLQGTLKEVELISNEIKTKSFTGLEATESNFRENSEKYDILHLAMHAFINDSLPTLSQFAFIQQPQNDLESDGLLSTADIYNLNLNARLAVLSACNTGSGKLRKGEGVISMARGFLYAGCPSIIMTLWEVEDNSGTKIMNSFYGNLKKGKTKDEALRLAKLEYLSDANPRLAHPHYWLGYVSIGDDSALFKSYDYYFFSLLLLAIIGIIVEQMIRIKKARKKRAAQNNL